MGLSVDISKLTGSQTWQVILSTLFIAGVTVGAVVIRENKALRMVEEARETTIFIKVGQEYIKENINEIKAYNKSIQDDIDILSKKIDKNADAINAYQKATKAWIREQSEETRKQLRLDNFEWYMQDYDNVLKKNGMLPPTVYQESISLTPQ